MQACMAGHSTHSMQIVSTYCFTFQSRTTKSASDDQRYPEIKASRLQCHMQTSFTVSHTTCYIAEQFGADQLLKPMGIGEEAKLLNAALHAVQETLHNEAAHRLFGKPVDHQALQLTDYLDVIGNQPVDLGTIAQRLKDGKRSNFRRSHYSTAAEVLADAELVFTNCLKYNSGPGADNKRIRSETADARNAFLVAWQQAKLQDARVFYSAPKTKKRSENLQRPLKPPAAQRESISLSAAPVSARTTHGKVLPPELPPLDPASCVPESALSSDLSITAGLLPN
jgi:hypothetical protein